MQDGARGVAPVCGEGCSAPGKWVRTWLLVQSPGSRSNGLSPEGSVHTLLVKNKQTEPNLKSLNPERFSRPFLDVASFADHILRVNAKEDTEKRE